MYSDQNPIEPVLEYKLILLKKLASELERLKQDVLILENILESYKNENINNLSHGDCLLDVKGFSFSKKLTKYDYIQLLSILVKRNEYLKKSLFNLSNVNTKRNRAITEFIDLCHQLLSNYSDSHEEDAPFIIRKENVEILLKKIFKIIADKAVIKHRIRDRDEVLSILQTKIKQFTALHECIKHKQGTQEHFINQQQLRETSAKLELENKELSDVVKNLTQIYNDLVSKTEGLKEYDHRAINQIVLTQFSPEEKDYRRFSEICGLMENSSKSLISIKSRRSVGMVENEKAKVSRLYNASDYLNRQAKKLDKFKRQAEMESDFTVKRD